MFSELNIASSSDWWWFSRRMATRAWSHIFLQTYLKFPGGICMPSCGIWVCKAGLFSESANTLAFPKQLFPGLVMLLLPAFTPKGTSQLIKLLSLSIGQLLYCCRRARIRYTVLMPKELSLAVSGPDFSAALVWELGSGGLSAPVICLDATKPCLHPLWTLTATISLYKSCMVKSPFQAPGQASLAVSSFDHCHLDGIFISWLSVSSK